MSTNAATKPPTRETGYLVPGLEVPGANISIFGSWESMIEDSEHVPALRWPDSISVYDRMRADPQIDALLRGMFLPIRRFRWTIDPGEAKEEAVNMLSEDLKIPILGEPPPKRRRQAFSFSDHLRHALLALVYGHMYFEQVGTIEKNKWRLRKLAPRMPASIQEISVARDGGLKYIKQREEWNPPEIKVGSLLAYIFDKEGANWVGRSLLRSAYQPWLLKDRLLRVDGIRHERNGMGVPIVELPERATDSQRKEANALAQQYKTGMASGGAVPFGMKVRLVGVEGSTSDVLASIRYHDEAMAKLMLQIFTSLGGSDSNSSRALGDSFIQFFAKAQESVAEWFSETFIEHMIADWMEWNYGTESDLPVLLFKRDEDPELSAHELSQLVAMKALTVDEELENFLRDKYGLPPLKGTRPVVNEPVPNDGNAPPDEGEPNENVNNPPPDRPGSTPAAAISPLSVTTRFRRESTEVEAASSADFPQMQSEWEQAVREAVAMWRPIRDSQIEELVDAVRAASGIAELGIIEPTAIGADEIESILQRMSVSGVEQAYSEAARQGVDLPRPDPPGTRPLAEAIAQVVARSLGASAARVATRSGPGERGAEAVRAWANTLTDVYLEETLGGTLTSAQNLGRFAVWAQAGEEAQFFASEILDANVCSECARVDKKPYASLQEALLDYPSGMYAHCLAGSRCRGTIVAVFGGGFAS